MVHLDKISTAIWVFDMDTMRIEWANQEGIKWWLAKDLDDLRSRDLAADASDAVKQSLIEYKKRFERKERFLELWQFSPKGENKTGLCWFSGLCTNDNKIKMMVEAMPTDSLDSAMLSQSTAAIVCFSYDGSFVSANPSFYNLFGKQITHIQSLFIDAAEKNRFLASIENDGFTEQEIPLQCSGHTTWFKVQGSKSINQAQQTVFLFHLNNIDEQKKRSKHIRQQALIDPLTQLFSRAGFVDTLKKSIGSNQQWVILSIDIDGFKRINESLGDENGDAILDQVAGRLTACSPSSAIISRFGSDEFLVKIDLTSKKELSSLTQAYSEYLSTPYQDLAGNLMALTLSIGVAMYPGDSSQFDQVIHFADMARHCAKKLSRQNWALFESGMELAFLRKNAIVQRLSLACKLDTFMLYYQPIVDTELDQICGFEALIRWKDTSVKNVSPQELIATAEETGLIHEIEAWVIKRAISDLPLLRKYTKTNAKISINISGLTITREDLKDDCLKLLKQHHLQPNDLVLEITESIFLDEVTQNENLLNKLIESGIELSIDDFGTGYSSLAYLHYIKATTVKIDRAFVDPSKVSDKSLKAINQLIDSLGFKSLIEGVETLEQAQRAKSIGISLHQGYLYSRPQPLEYFQNNVIKISQKNKTTYMK